MIDYREIRHAHLYCGLGGGKKGFNRGQARVGNMVGTYRCIGGIDSVPACIADFNAAGPGRGTVMDLFDREQYVAWHGHQPPADWHEATPADVIRAFGGERPHILFTSPPCKGFSGLLSSNRSVSDKYQALNRLTLRGIWLTLEAYKDDPIEFFLLENVPLIQSRGRHLLEQIRSMLEHYGYAVALTTHDCGELGGLGQSRKRFLLVARHQEKVPPFLYQPRKKPLLPVGRVLERFALPGDLSSGPMHRIPRLQWKTWVRLAFVEAGSDWRSLEKYIIENGVMRDFGLMPETEYRQGPYGVTAWEQPSGTVAGRSGPTNGAFSVADPRGETFKGGRGVLNWDETAGAVSGESLPPAAEAIASIMGQTLLQAWSGETFLLSDTDIWVRDVAIALTMPGQVV
ncbi:MAG TPA: DNA cytosine methyltransferase [Gammaproteobacteria bacterium]|jgi:site-specific DNA-cytosine methylase